MMVRIHLKGLNKVTSNMGRINRQIEEAVINTNAIIANKIQGEARRTVPVFEGILRKDIKVKTKNFTKSFRVTIGSTKAYAAAIEFGYNGLNRLPNLDKLRRWVISKGMPASATYNIALKLKRKGSRAQPYLVPAFDKYVRKYADILRFKLSGVR